MQTTVEPRENVLKRYSFELYLYFDDDNNNITYLCAYNLQYDYTLILHSNIQTGNPCRSLDIDTGMYRGVHYSLVCTLRNETEFFSGSFKHFSLGVKATCVGIVVCLWLFIFHCKNINRGNKKRKKESPIGKMEDIL